jgi:hypothetical protein
MITVFRVGSASEDIQGLREGHGLPTKKETRLLLFLLLYLLV